jgi:hypothetical protein
VDRRRRALLQDYAPSPSLLKRTECGKRLNAEKKQADLGYSPSATLSRRTPQLVIEGARGYVVSAAAKYDRHAIREHESSWLAPEGDDGRFDFYVAVNGR